MLTGSRAMRLQWTIKMVTWVGNKTRKIYQHITQIQDSQSIFSRISFYRVKNHILIIFCVKYSCVFGCHNRYKLKEHLKPDESKSRFRSVCSPSEAILHFTAIFKRNCQVDLCFIDQMPSNARSNSIFRYRQHQHGPGHI